MEKIIFWGIWVLLGIIMLIYYRSSKKPIRNAIGGMLSGAFSLMAAHFWGGYIGAALSLNLFNIVVALILGFPGVVMLAVGELLL